MNATPNQEQPRTLWKRLAGWAAVTTLILAIPKVAMRFTNEVAWTSEDFIFASVLIMGVGVTYELAAMRGNAFYRAAVGVALAAVFMLIWFTGAVGIIGSEAEPANLMFAGVLAVGLVGALTAHFRATGMSHAMAAAAVAQASVGVIALVARWGASDPSWPLDIIGATGFFTALWLLSAWFFRQSARAQNPSKLA